MADPEGPDRALVTAVDFLGGLDGVVAAAGIVDTVHRAARFPREAWDRDIAVNLTAHFLVAQAAYPPMREGGGGRVVFVSSAASRAAGLRRGPAALRRSRLVGLQL